MTKYNSVSRREPIKKARQMHPIWRGIGCLFTILIPVISFAASYLTIGYGLDHDWPIPYQLLGYPRLPEIIYKFPAIATLFSPLTRLEHLYAILILALFYMLVLGGTLAIVNAYIYQVAGPPRWGPLDVPPPKIRTKRYKR